MVRFKLSRSIRPVMIFTGIAVFAVISSSLFAVEDQTDHGQKLTAQELAQEALYHEVYGDQSTRDRLLEKAIQLNPDYAPARWNLGFVKVQGDWIKADALIDLNRDNKKLREYERLRTEDPPETAAEHMAVASWCRGKKLFMQRRAHLEAVIAIEPNHNAARNLLGHTRVGSQWMTREQIDSELDKLRQDRENLHQWRGKLTTIGQRLHSENVRVQKQAELELAAIDDASAILPMELILSSIDEPTSQLVVETISGISDHEAAISLARHAVFSPFKNIRQQASLKLRNYDQYSWVPTMLSTMETEVINMKWATPGDNGRLYYRHVLFVETQDTKQTAINEVEYRRVPVPGGIRQQTLNRVLADMNREAAQTDMAVRMRNMQTRDLNSRITSALTVATSENVGEDPRDWWQWWDDENDVLVQQKSYLVDTQRRSAEYADQVQVSGGQSGAVSCECLVAGTKVMTGRGLKAVELIATGDVVLSKNPIDGELAFKPVTRTTIRPGTDVVTFIAGDQKISCSDGHPFWVSGDGWTMAKDLKSGMSLHTSQGVVPIVSVSKADKQETYNLVVADFHTYFVGSEQILSHDVTMREAATTGVPGLNR